MGVSRFKSQWGQKKKKGKKLPIKKKPKNVLAHEKWSEGTFFFSFFFCLGLLLLTENLFGWLELLAWL